MQQYSSVWHHMAKILLISTSPLSYIKQSDVLAYFFNLGFINVAIAINTANGIEISSDSFIGRMIVLRNEFDIDFIFPDKLTDLKGYEYRIIVYNQVPRVVIINGEVYAPLGFYIVLVMKQQNANARFIQLLDYRNMIKLYDGRQMDLTLNTGTSYPDALYPKLLTYEEAAYCALVPKTKRTF